MGLVPCAECGKSVSEQADECPNPYCRTNKPHGVSCRKCGVKLKQSESVRQNNLGYTNYYHEACLAPLFAHDGRCRECGAAVWSARLWKRSFEELKDTSGQRCPDCRAPNPLKCAEYSCSECQTPVFLQLHGGFQDEDEGWTHELCKKKGKGGGVGALVALGGIVAVALFLVRC